MSDLPSQIIRFADLRQRQASPFAIDVTDAARRAIMAELELLDLRKLRFIGKLTPHGARDWHLTAELGATVTQSCVVTLDPVTTRIDEKIKLHYAEGFEMPEASEVEMPDDDTIEPLPASIDLALIMIEALSLALPPFPRAVGAELGEIAVTEPGKAAMTDDDAKPFAGLAGLRAALDNTSDPEGSKKD